jgi:hypothetical protein
MELPALMDLPLVGSGVDGTLIRRSVIDLLFRFCFPCAYVSLMSLEFAFFSDAFAMPYPSCV